jgi:hypothetical protein
VQAAARAPPQEAAADAAEATGRCRSKISRSLSLSSLFFVLAAVKTSTCSLLSARRVSINYLTNEAAAEVNRSKSKFQTRVCLLCYYRYATTPHGIRGWLAMASSKPSGQAKHNKKRKRAKKPSGFERSESGAALPARARSIALLSFCSFGRFSAAHGSRALPRSSWRGRAPRFNPFLLPCGDVTPLPLALSADGGTGTTRRGRSRSRALVRAAASHQRRQRQRLCLAGHGCARFVAFVALKSLCSYVASFFVAMRSNSFLASDEEEGRDGASSAESQEVAEAANDSFSYSLRGNLIC